MSEPIVSGSMLDDWGRCKRKFYYGHVQHLQLKERDDDPKALGTAGHVVMAAYFTRLMGGESHTQAVKEAEGDIAWRAEVLRQTPALYERLLPWARYYWAERGPRDAAGWQVVEVEQRYSVPRAGWTFALTIDLIVRERATGQLAIVDHRFLWEPYTQEMAKLDPQLPRYALALRQLTGEHVTLAYRNMISTKPFAALAKANHGRTKRVPVPLTQQRLDLVAAETEAAGQEVLTFLGLDSYVQNIMARRTVITGERYPACSACEFFKLCSAEAWGEDTTKLRAEKYEPNTYGYTEAPL